jgi:hypothetical protein
VLAAEYQYTVMHIPGRTNPADFITHKRFRDGQGPALTTGYYDPGSSLELTAAVAFTHVGTCPNAPRFLHSEFAAALRVALPADPLLGPLLAAAQASAPGPVSATGSARPTTCPRARLFIARDGLLYRQSPRGDCLCIPAAGEHRVQVLRELHATPLGGHFGRDKTLALVRSSVWWPGLPAAVEVFVQTCFLPQVRTESVLLTGGGGPPLSRIGP